jgi:CHAT domain-containing protein
VPVHAASFYDNGGGKGISDYVVSSYTHSLTALLRAQQTAVPLKREELKALIVTEPNAPGLQTLPSIVAEVEAISKSIPSECVLSASESTAKEHNVTRTIHEVLGLFHRAAVVHFACHGQQDPHNPLKSGFCLRDGKLTVGKIMQQQSPSAFFAFLSACETAKGDRSQPDQSVHLAAAMLFAGFRSIVGTMWYVPVPYSCVRNLRLPQGYERRRWSIRRCGCVQATVREGCR